MYLLHKQTTNNKMPMSTAVTKRPHVQEKRTSLLHTVVPRKINQHELF